MSASNDRIERAARRSPYSCYDEPRADEAYTYQRGPLGRALALAVVLALNVVMWALIIGLLWAMIRALGALTPYAR